MTSENVDLRAICALFPSLRHAFAYGSGIYTQPGLYNGGTLLADRASLDFIFVVENPASWHYENMHRNRDHYSFLAWLHPPMMTTLAERLGAGIYFNPSVKALDQTIKYGVIGVNTLLRDLHTWDTLQVAGRLHKPVKHIIRDPAIMAAIDTNLESALVASLLTLPQAFTTVELLEAICGLSYLGDIRVGLAEDSHKVRRIVTGSYRQLQELYRPFLQGVVGKMAGLTSGADETWTQSTDNTSRAQLLAALPQAVQARLPRMPAGQPGQGTPAAAALRLLEGQEKSAGELVRGAVSCIVRRSSIRQAALGLLTAGGFRSAAYLLAKARKRWGSGTQPL